MVLTPKLNYGGQWREILYFFFNPPKPRHSERERGTLYLYSEEAGNFAQERGLIFKEEVRDLRYELRACQQE